jgi:2-polyprenyl-3-methyl-5-hydroxy-6-metoxy-1,4-benzoquinol methylase
MRFLSERRLQAELMDQPGLDEASHFQALRGLERINRWSGSARILWPALRALASEITGRPLHVLDIASGAGDVPIRLWQKARRVGVALEIEGCDVSPQAVAFAQRRALQSNANVRFFALDVLKQPLPTSYDAITSSLFLHHLSEEQAIDLLRRAGAAVGRLLLVNDLARGLAGFALAYLGTRVLSSSHVVHVDGPRSVEAAFTRQEALELARRAGLVGATAMRRWPCRFLLNWSKRAEEFAADPRGGSRV